MSGEKDLIPIENYRTLASAIVEVACVDYVDAKIIALYGYLSLKKYKMQLYKAVISYGEVRYIRKSGNTFIRQNEIYNMQKRSASCAIFMPPLIPSFTSIGSCSA